MALPLFSSLFRCFRRTSSQWLSCAHASCGHPNLFVIFPVITLKIIVNYDNLLPLECLDILSKSVEAMLFKPGDYGDNISHPTKDNVAVGYRPQRLGRLVSFSLPHSETFSVGRLPASGIFAPNTSVLRFPQWRLEKSFKTFCRNLQITIPEIYINFIILFALHLTEWDNYQKR